MSLADKLREERRKRLAAERLLELKQAELFAANRKLGDRAQRLSEEIVETRAENAAIRGENQRVKSDLSAAARKVELTERRLWHSIESLDDGFAFFDADHRLIFANQAYLSVFEGLENIKPGISYVTLLQILTDEGIVDTGDLDPDDWRQMMIERFQSPMPKGTKVRLWNGEYFRLSDQRSAEGDTVSIAMNITSRVKYEEELEEARRAAESASLAKSSFLANMTHELRTPMNGIIGMVDLLLDSKINEEQQLCAQTIKNSAEALLEIINDVLDYSKIGASRLELKNAVFDLREVPEEVALLLMPSAREKGLALQVTCDPDLPDGVIGDRGRLRQVLTNLIGNAVKFTQEGGIDVEVSLADTSTDTHVAIHVAVRDTGIGIPEEMTGQIFGEFNQVENARNRAFEGTGLGLSITQALVRLMGGEIEVASTLGQGSCFSFTVFFRRDADGSLAKRGTRRGDLYSRGPRRLRILAADDNPTNQLVLSKLLAPLNVDLIFADDGEAAVDLFASFTPDLVFMDISMPKMDGKEAARRIRRMETGRPTRILAVTAFGDPEEHKSILAAGLDDLLSKPLRQRQLIEQIEAVHGPEMLPLYEDQEVG